VSVGADTTIRPFTHIGRDTSIGGDCVIGPFACIPRGSIVTEGTTIDNNVGRD
jgi:UDP-3-O-[3-hydroxymyristoyl] glucosamine N-acyltransferase